MAKLDTPRITVILSDPDFPGDDEGREYKVSTRNVELCAYERERVIRKWPKGEDAPFLWLTFLAWRALQRTGQITACSLAEFEQRCLSVSSKEEDAEPVDPTPPAAEPGSSSP